MTFGFLHHTNTFAYLITGTSVCLVLAHSDGDGGGGGGTDLYIYILDAVPPVHVVSYHVGTDKLTTANGRTFTSSSVSLCSQSR